MLFRYLAYLKRARGPFRLHSPFAFQFHQKVLRGRKMPELPMHCRGFRLRWPDEPRNVVRREVEGQLRRNSLDAIARKESVSKRDAAILFRLAHFLKPEIILEFGTCLGYSAICLASGAPAADVISIDQDAALLEIAGNRSKAAGLSNIRFLEGKFRDLMPGLMAQEGPFDLVFIDGDHREAETLFLAEQIRPNLSKSGVMVVHDIHHSAEMMRAWQRLIRMPEYSLSLSTFSMGFLFVSEDFQKQYLPIRM